MLRHSLEKDWQQASKSQTYVTTTIYLQIKRSVTQFLWQQLKS